MEPNGSSLEGERGGLLSALAGLGLRELDAGLLVFVDEVGANVSLCPIYAWSRRGERILVKAPRMWGKDVTPLASMS